MVGRSIVKSCQSKLLLALTKPSDMHSPLFVCWMMGEDKAVGFACGHFWECKILSVCLKPLCVSKVCS